MVRQGNFFDLSQIRVVVDRGVKVKEDGQIKWLVWVEQLVFETEALDFIEVQGTLFRENLIDSDTSDWLVWSVEYFIESEGSLTSINQELGRFRLELPGNLIFSVAHEADSPLTEHVHFLCWGAVVLCMLTHREAEGLTDNVVEGNSEKVTSEKKQAESIHSVELTPLRFLLE